MKFSIKNYTKTDILFTGWIIMNAINFLHSGMQIANGLSFISPPIMIANILLSIALLVWPLKRDNNYCKENHVFEYWLSLLCSTFLLVLNPVYMMYGLLALTLVMCGMMIAVVVSKEFISVEEAKQQMDVNIKSFKTYLYNIENPLAIQDRVPVQKLSQAAENFQTLLIDRSNPPLLGKS
jgi:hypothetical protein